MRDKETSGTLLPQRATSYQGSYGFCKLMEIENAIFQDLESFGREYFQKGYGTVLDFCLEKFNNILKWM